MSIRRSFIALAAILAIPLLAAADAARAADLCIDAAQGNTPTFVRPIVIARSFKIPKKNKCKPLTGVLVGTGSAVVGSACTSSDGGHVTFVLTAATVAQHSTAPGDYLAGSTTYTARMELPALTGGLSYQDAATNGIFTYVATAYTCPKGAYPDNL